LAVVENVALPLQMLAHLDTDAIDTLADLKLAFVGMAAAAGRMPSELSGGMRKRAALARALALDPEILFFDEPSALLVVTGSNPCQRTPKRAALKQDAKPASDCQPARFAGSPVIFSVHQNCPGHRAEQPESSP
jgi:ABC-type Na+ transport system ATPase subunit NatA